MADEPEVSLPTRLSPNRDDVESAEPQTAPASDADDVEQEPEDESVIEAETVSTGVSVETAVDAEDDLIDEDHDPIGEDELEGLSGGDAPPARYRSRKSRWRASRKRRSRRPRSRWSRKRSEPEAAVEVEPEAPEPGAAVEVEPEALESEAAVEVEAEAATPRRSR